MIYCVIPQELADELYDKLCDYYRDDPNVKVIVDRRRGERRRDRDRQRAGDRRRPRIPGTFPPVGPAS